MAYVFDASTLILLAKITSLRDFAKNKKIIITPCVKKESLKKHEAFDAKIIDRLLQEKKITQWTKKVITTYEHGYKLGPGEAEALTIAYKEGYILATDDLRAIKACKVLDVKFVNAIHCLLSQLKDCTFSKEIILEKFKKLEKYGRYHPDIIKHAKAKIEGEKNG
jgi:predicted nucleic acid-binding protein